VLNNNHSLNSQTLLRFKGDNFELIFRNNNLFVFDIVSLKVRAGVLNNDIYFGNEELEWIRLFTYLLSVSVMHSAIYISVVCFSNTQCCLHICCLFQ